MGIRSAGLLGMLALCAAPLAAQGRVEIGTQAGFMYRSGHEAQGEPTLAEFSIPGGGLLGRPTIWATIFVARRFAVEPHFSYRVVRDVDLDETEGTLGVSLRGVWYVGDPRQPSFYAFGDGALDRSRQFQVSRESDTDFALGGGAGYHWPFGDHFGIRAQGLYRYWIDDRRNELAVTVGFGVVAKRR